MKKALLALCCSGLIWTGCKEKNAAIVFPTPVAVGNEGTYLGPDTVTARPHNVLVEEFTGQSCDRCPTAETILNGILSQSVNAGRVNIVGLYAFGGPQNLPPSGALYDFRDSISNQIGFNIFQANSMPTAGIDRTAYNTNLT